MRRVRWGVLSTADIGLNKVIPAMQRSELCHILGIASRDADRARAAAERSGIPRSYGSYESLLADPEIEAVYVPLPNHLHVDWSIKAIEAGKHVLCEKPLGLDAADASRLLAVADQHPNLKVMEAFMYRHHPQWQTAKQLAKEGQIGELRTVNTLFSYFLLDPNNVRNMPDIGGGGLMDIGCYCISVARFLFDAEPARVLGMMDYDPELGTDRLTSGMMDFDRGTATWTCSTQLAPYQRVNICGTEGRIEIEIPFNAPPDRPCRLWHERAGETRELNMPICDQYTIQGDLFSRAILDDTDVPTPLADGWANMVVIDAIVQSASDSKWVELEE